MVRRLQRVGDAWHGVCDNADKVEHPDMLLGWTMEAGLAVVWH